jgi:hypothetical protein
VGELAEGRRVRASALYQAVPNATVLNRRA